LRLARSDIVTSVHGMNRITICYSTHRPETLQFTDRIMQQHDVIILEEPAHPAFTEVLKGKIDIQDHLLELDAEYPQFIIGQYQLLQNLYLTGKTILQIEPFVETLLRIQYFFADGHSPDEIEPDTVESMVYAAERNATEKLISYYKSVRENEFALILATMNDFAQADAARFVLRDTLRAAQIKNSLQHGMATYIEAGSIHLLLYKLLARQLAKESVVRIHSVDREAMKKLNGKGTYFSPGDILTLHYIMGRKVYRQKWERYCAQALIYSKIIVKEEISGEDSILPHTHNELECLAAVKQLSVDQCREIFQRVRLLPARDAAMMVLSYVSSLRAGDLSDSEQQKWASSSQKNV